MQVRRGRSLRQQLLQQRRLTARARRPARLRLITVRRLRRARLRSILCRHIQQLHTSHTRIMLRKPFVCVARPELYRLSCAYFAQNCR